MSFLNSYIKREEGTIFNPHLLVSWAKSSLDLCIYSSLLMHKKT